MNEFIEKLIARLEERELLLAPHAFELSMAGGCTIIDEMAFGSYRELGVVKEIVNQLAEEHNGGWIPCSERLPDHMQTVLFTNEDGYVDCGWYDANENWCVNDNYFPNAFRFIAWQPLPDPYKEPERVDRNIPIKNPKS
jgi:hypothetical protein